MMSSQEYLQQAYLLELLIKDTEEKILYWKEKSLSVSSISFERHYSTNRSTIAPFEVALKQMYKYQEELDEKLSLMMALRQQIDLAIDQVEDRTERLLLTYRYVNNYTWDEIASVFHYANSTVRRIHNEALAHFKVPNDAITI